jgi:hypothetical protein
LPHQLSLQSSGELTQKVSAKLSSMLPIEGRHALLRFLLRRLTQHSIFPMISTGVQLLPGELNFFRIKHF